MSLLEGFRITSCQKKLTYPDDSDGKESAHSTVDRGLIPGSGRSPEEGNGNPLQYPCLEYPMDGGTWQAIVYGVAKSQTRLSDLTSIKFDASR